MSVSLTPAEADQKIQQIEQARAEAVKKLQQINDAQEQMMQANWHGGSANTFQQVTQGQNEEFRDLIKVLDATVQKGSEHIRAVVNADNG